MAELELELTEACPSEPEYEQPSHAGGKRSRRKSLPRAHGSKGQGGFKQLSAEKEDAEL